MDSEVYKPVLAGIARHVLTSLGGVLVAGGYMQSSDLAAFVGAGMVLAGIAWSWWQKTGQDRFIAMLAKMKPVAPPSATTGEAVKAAKEAVKSASVILIALVLGGLLLGGGEAHADLLKKPQATAAASTTPATGLAKFMADLAVLQTKVVTDVVADITAADTDAATLTNPNDPASFRDPIAHACYPAAIKFLTSLPVSSAPTGTLVGVQLFQKKRDFVMQIQAGLPNYLKLGCAPLLGDEAQIFAKLLSLVGVNVALNALVPGAGALSSLAF